MFIIAGVQCKFNVVGEGPSSCHPPNDMLQCTSIYITMAYYYYRLEGAVQIPARFEI